MTESTPEKVVEETPPEEKVVEETPPVTVSRVYDEAELRFVDGRPGETPAKTAKRLNDADRESPKAGHAGRGRRYNVREV